MIVTIPIALDLMKSVHTKQRLTLRCGDDEILCAETEPCGKTNEIRKIRG